jgi:hypothetical protein
MVSGNTEVAWKYFSASEKIISAEVLLTFAYKKVNFVIITGILILRRMKNKIIMAVNVPILRSGWL